MSLNPKNRQGRLKRLRVVAAAGFRLTVALTIGSVVLSAQPLRDALTTAATDMRRAGFSVGVSAFSGFTSSNINEVLGATSSDPLATFPDRFLMAGVSFSLGWHKMATEHSSFNIAYSPTYFYQTNGVTSRSSTNLSPLQGTFALDWQTTLGRKLTMALSGSVAAGSFAQLSFMPSGEQGLASLAGTSADLSSAFNASPIGGIGISQTITALQPLYGDHSLSASGNLALTYALSPRLNITGVISVNRTQHLGDTNSSPHLLNQTTAGSAMMTASYGLSPRTRLFGSVNYSRPISSILGAETVTAQLGLTRDLTEHLFARVSAGAGTVTGTNGSVPARNQTIRAVASASVGYRVFRQTFVGSVSKSLSSFYAVGVPSTISASGAWTWSKPGSDWGAQASVSRFWLQGGILNNSVPDSSASAQPGLLGDGGYSAHVGLYRSLASQVRVSLSYVYSSASLLFPTATTPAGIPINSKLQALRLNLSWSPQLGMAGAANANPANVPNSIP